MIAAGSHVEGAKVNLLGLPFKENCSDLRNSKVIDIIRELRSHGADLYVTDPRLGAEEAMHEYCVKVLAGDELLVPMLWYRRSPIASSLRWGKRMSCENSSRLVDRSST